jgi:hypothetical protein
MNADAGAMQGDPAAGAPSEAELRAAYEAELARISATDMIAQAAVSLLNIGAHRIGAPAGGGEQETDAPPAGQDLEQARDAIDAARALLEILERRIPGELGPLRDALSRLQMAYATEQGRSESSETQPVGAPQPAPPESPEPQPGAPAAGQTDEESGPGPAEASGRLWVPGR